MIYDANSARLALGCMMIEPPLCHDGKHKFNKSDFEANEFHLRLWQAIVHLASHGAKDISAIDIYNVCDTNAAVSELFDTNNLKDFVETVKQLARINNFDLYYDSVKKCSLLNNYKSNGFDISPFEGDYERHSIEEIVTYYDTIQQKIKSNYYADKEVEEVKAGDGMEDVLASFESDPLYGATTFSKYLNEAVRGWVRGQLTVFTVPSGIGKTSLGLDNAVLIGCPRIWSDEANAYVDNPCYQHCAVMYAQWELDTRRELTPKILASISHVPCFSILDNNYAEGEKERVAEAINILHESEIYLVKIPNYTIPMLETYVRQYANLHSVRYVVLDYIAESVALTNEYASGSKTAVRTDQVLLGVAGCLKNLATELNVGVLSWTQASNNINSQDNMDSSVIAGAKAIQNVCDVAGVITKLTKKDEETAQLMADGGKFDTTKMPNRIIHTYKVRFGKHPQGLKIWGYADLNTGIWYDCFCTTIDNKPYSMPKLTLTYD